MSLEITDSEIMDSGFNLIKTMLAEKDEEELVNFALDLGLQETSNGIDISNLSKDEILEEITYFVIYMKPKDAAKREPTPKLKVTDLFAQMKIEASKRVPTPKTPTPKTPTPKTPTPKTPTPKVPTPTPKVPTPKTPTPKVSNPPTSKLFVTNKKNSYIFDVENVEWTVLEDKKISQTTPAVAYLNGIVYVAGGNLSGQITNRVMQYDIKSNKWSETTPMNIPRRGAAAAVLNGQIYVSGGLLNHYGIESYTKTVEIYSPDTKEWGIVSDMNETRKEHKLISINNYIYAIGGENGTSSLKTVERYDPVENKWTYMSSMFIARENFGIDIYDNHIYVAGGSNLSGAIPQCERYNVNKNKWEFIKNLPEAYKNTALISSRNVLLSIVNKDIFMYDENDDEEWTYLDPSFKSLPDFILAGTTVIRDNVDLQLSTPKFTPKTPTSTPKSIPKIPTPTSTPTPKTPVPTPTLPKKMRKSLRKSRKACKSGKIRDRSTKRCRSKKVAGRKTSRKPCKQGKTRDKSTKRCRTKKVSGRPIIRTPCKNGKTRDRSTKRCRSKKIAGSSKI